MKTKPVIDITEVRSYLCDLQDRICTMLAQEDGDKEFIRDEWQYANGGGGCSRVLEQGAVIEKGGVNFSHVQGTALPQAASAQRPEIAGAAFEALGVSLVIHPLNPYAPTSHMNVRLIIASKPDQPPVWWFGGGFDLTPYYGFEEDCRHWHQVAKQACDPFGKDVYPKYKKWCDDYFYLPHRDEPRGIGGIFFDDLNQWNFTTCFDFIKSIGEGYIKAYQPILNQRKNTPYSERERNFQLYRRGRYAEFNLLQDRGTLFGIKSKGRTESILMSLPPTVTSTYNWQPTPGSKEAELYNHYLKPKAWI